LSWLGDEKLLLAAAGLAWLVLADRPGRERQAATRLLADVAVTAVLPHLVKGIVAQERPDRCEVNPPRYGIPRSGQPYDAFPSGHAMHMGALAAGLASVAPSWRLPAVLLCTAVSASRVLILAHWLSDVVIGFAAGVGVDRLVAAFLGGPSSNPRPSLRRVG